MKFCIGIEGGGSRTRIISSINGEQRDFWLPPVSLKVRDGNFGQAAAELAELLTPVLPLPENVSSATVSIAMGLSGMSRVEDQDGYKAAIHAIPVLSKAKLHIESDATLTLNAVLPEGEEGILLIAGTGSVSYYKTKDGMARRIGGWGSLLSDGGSGYGIGLESLRTYMYMLDGAFRPEALTNAIEKWLPKELKRDQTALVRHAQTHPEFIASVARFAFEQHENSNEAREIIEEGVAELSTLIYPILSSKLLTDPPPHKLYLSGSVAKHPFTTECLQGWLGDQQITYIPVEEHVPCMKALEIAKAL